MNGLTLLRVFDSIYLAALGVWLGTIAFCTLGIRPLFRSHPCPADLEVQCRRRSYMWGACCGALALPALVCGALGVPELRGVWLGVQAAVLLVLLLAMLQQAGKRVDSAPGDKTQPQPAQSRQPSIDGIAITLLGALIVAHAHRPSVTSVGIVDPDPMIQYQAYTQRMREKVRESWRDYFEAARKEQEAETARAASRSPAESNTNTQTTRPDEPGTH